MVGCWATLMVVQSGFQVEALQPAVVCQQQAVAGVVGEQKAGALPAALAENGSPTTRSARRVTPSAADLPAALTARPRAPQWLMVRELFKLAEHAQRQQPKPPGTGRAAQWYFFGVAAFWVYLRFIQVQLTVEVTSNARLAHLFGWVLKKHTIIAFSLYTAGVPRGAHARRRAALPAAALLAGWFFATRRGMIRCREIMRLAARCRRAQLPGVPCCGRGLRGGGLFAAWQRVAERRGSGAGRR